MSSMKQENTVVDAEGLIVGRMASMIAKRLLEGEHVIIVNAERAVLSGRKKDKVREFKEFIQVGHPKKGPFHHRRPDRILRRTIRGMLPYKRQRGKQAYKRLRVFTRIPEELESHERETLHEAAAHRLKCSYLTLGELSKEIGWNSSE